MLTKFSFKEAITMYRNNRIPIPKRKSIGYTSTLETLLTPYRPYFNSLLKGDSEYVTLFRLYTLAGILTSEDAQKHKHPLLTIKSVLPCINYYNGYILGLRGIKDKSINNFESLAYEAFKLRLGLLDVVYESENKIIIDVYECIICSGLPSLGKPVCDFMRGFFSATVSHILKREVIVKEVECWATGSNKCRFIIESRGVKNST